MWVGVWEGVRCGGFGMGDWVGDGRRMWEGVGD